MVKISLKAARVNADLSQKEAAKMLKISNATLGKWEKGTAFPSMAQVPKICDLYKLPYDSINFLPNDSL